MTWHSTGSLVRVPVPSLSFSSRFTSQLMGFGVVPLSVSPGTFHFPWFMFSFLFSLGVGGGYCQEPDGPESFQEQVSETGFGIHVPEILGMDFRILVS